MATTSKCTAKNPPTCPHHGGFALVTQEAVQACEQYKNALRENTSEDRVRYLKRKWAEKQAIAETAKKLGLHGSKQHILAKVEEDLEANEQPYARFERSISNAFKPGDKVTFNNEQMQVIFATKPLSRTNGEGKTDTFLLLKKADGSTEEVKISIKKSNADFVENKLQAQRARNVLGENWKQRLTPALKQLSESLKDLPQETPKGDLTLGYRLDVVNKPTGDRTVKMNLTHKEVVDFYSGETLHEDKRHSFVSDKYRKNSGTATHLLFGDSFANGQEILNKLETVDSYAKRHPDLYIAAKAVNLRKGGKVESARPLGLYYVWDNADTAAKLTYENPLSITSTLAKTLVPARFSR